MSFIGVALPMSVQGSHMFSSFYDQFLPKANPQKRKKVVRVKSKKSTIRLKKDQSSTSSNLSYEYDFDEIKRRALNGRSLMNVSPEIFPEIIESLKEDREKYLENDVFDKYTMADDAIVLLAGIYEKYMERKFKDEYQECYSSRLENAKCDLTDVEIMHKRKRTELIQQLQCDMLALQEKHLAEIQSLNEYWKSEDTIRKYNRTSSKIRNLQVESVRLRNAHRFSEMRYVENQCAQLMKTESDINYRSYVFDYQEAAKKLMEKQKREAENQRRTNKTRLEVLETQFSKRTQIVEYRVNKLQSLTRDTGKADNAFRMVVADQAAGSARSTMRDPVRISTRGSLSSRNVHVSEFNTVQLPPLPEMKIKNGVDYNTIF